MNETSGFEDSRMNLSSSHEKCHSRSTTIASQSRSTKGNHSSEISFANQRPASLRQPVLRVPLPISSPSDNNTSHDAFQYSILTAPNYMQFLPRKPLPIIPVPSYDVALQTPELTQADVKNIPSLQSSGYLELHPPYAPPPLYEQ